MIARAKYASVLATAIGPSGSTLTILSADNIQGKSSGAGTPNATLAEDSFLLLRKPDPTDSKKWYQEVVQVTSIVGTSGGAITVEVNRDDDTFDGAPTNAVANNEYSGVWSVDPVTGATTFTVDDDTDLDFPSGTIVENLDANAQLRHVSAGAAADDWIIQPDTGGVRFLNVGNTGTANFAVNSGMTISVFGDYQTASGKRINLGRDMPSLEFILEFQHRFQDGRWFKGYFNKAAITPDNPEFAFDPENWIGAVLMTDLLKDLDPMKSTAPVGHLTVENDPITQMPVYDRTDNYSFGIYDLFLTPRNASIAAQYGIPVVRYDVGCVRIGTFRSPRSFLEHFRGAPQVLDKKYKIREQFQMESTLDEVNAENLALLFSGAIEDLQKGWAPFNSFITVTNAPAAPYTVSHISHPTGKMMINVA